MVGGGLQEPFFHQSEIKGLDNGITPITEENGGKQRFLWLSPC
jgi:hypothetical protein